MEYVVKIIADVLAALYQTAGASLLLAALVMCVYMLGRKQGAGPVVRAWIRQFRTSGWFRKHFFPGILCKYDAVSDTFVPNNLGKSSGSCARHLEFT